VRVDKPKDFAILARTKNYSFYLIFKKIGKISERKCYEMLKSQKFVFQLFGELNR